MRFWLAALVAVFVMPVAAHHPFTPYFDASRLVSMSGSSVELRATNPHAVLVVEGTAPDGRTGRWAFEGLPPNAYRYRGLANYKERLTPGTAITISGWAATDPQARAFSAKEVTFADGTKLLFGISAPGPQDGWKCDAPCPYTYPVP
jgi:hypothetical protein